MSSTAIRCNWPRAFAALLLWLALGMGAVETRAHEMRPAYLSLKQTSQDAYDVTWKVPARGNNERLSLRLNFPADARWPEESRARFIRGSFVERTRVVRQGGLTGAGIAIDGLAATYTDALVRIERLDGSSFVTRLTPTQPSFVVPAVPGRLEVLNTYLVLGVEHILLGIDHLLFVLALLLIVEGWRKLVATITAFTLAHSLTLGMAALGWVHVPGPPVEAIIALSIVFVAVEIIHVRRGRPSLTARRPWIVAFTFGLLHGFGFAGALAEIGLPQHAIPLALLCFNVGVELGQLLFVAGVLGLVALAQCCKLTLPASLRQAPPYAIGGIAMYWVIERVAGFL